MTAAGPRLTRRRWLQLVGSAGVAALAPWPARARPPAADAEAVVVELVSQLWAILGTHEIAEPERIDRMMSVLGARTDVQLLGRLALGRHWKRLSAAQQADFQALFGRVVIRNLARQLNGYAGNATGALEGHFAITGTVPAGKHDLLVRSKVTPRPGGNPIGVDWRLRPRADGLAIIDLVLEGASLLVTQRSEFAAVIERTSMDGLITELRARAGEIAPAG